MSNANRCWARVDAARKRREARLEADRWTAHKAAYAAGRSLGMAGKPPRDMPPMADQRQSWAEGYIAGRAAFEGAVTT